MSRIGRMPVAVPSGVTVNIKKNRVTVTGPKGELSRPVSPEIRVTQQDNAITVSRPSDSKEHRSLHGLTRSLVANMVTGVSNGFDKYLEIVGVGYRAEKAEDKLTFRVGHSHPVEITPLPGISFEVEGNRIKVSGINREVVGEMAARIRRIRPPDTYKGKGIRYAGERVHLKPGKAGKAIGKK
ncbi:MAG: 50S ribosomal protein L6 [Dehalococcoidales bacterium]|nr:50S ribosomal protein L6 [Dehalococcoidales bacterium]MDP6448526.1 50S ribosomal protein L6 [Dehalococcoidales bacterium]MDP6576720.1 50S ribosomal protein L6 [Dehalococcoidales bacterium]